MRAMSIAVNDLQGKEKSTLKKKIRNKNELNKINVNSIEAFFFSWC